MRREGRTFLAQLFGPILAEAKQSSSGNSSVARRILDALDHSSRTPTALQLPVEIRRALGAVYAAIIARNNNAAATRQAVITAFFMRFVNPALVNPTQANLHIQTEVCAPQFYFVCQFD